MGQNDVDTAAEGHAGGVDLRQVAALVGAIADGDGPLIESQLSDIHPADAADALEQLSNEQFQAAVALSPGAFSPDVLAELDVDLREAAIEELPVAKIAEAVTALDSDDARLVVEGLDEDRLEAVLAEVSERDRRAVEDSLAFDEETVGRLMQREFVAAPQFWTANDAIEHMRAAGATDLPETFFEIYVVDPGFRPIGVVTLAAFLRHPREAKLADIMAPLQVRITPDMDQEDAAYVFRKYHLAQAPVVDDAGRLTGMVTVDDVVDVIQEENAEDLLALAGVKEAGLAMTAVAQVRSRAPWLFINLCTALGASLVISAFSETIAELVALAVLMPIVSALGGSVGTQALAVSVRSLASRDLTAANTGRAIAREAVAALLNGLIFAALLGAIAALWFSNPALGGVIAAALGLTFLWGGVTGIVVPLTLQRLGADPAVASSVFVTASTDMVGFFLFLGFAAAVLG